MANDSINSVFSTIGFQNYQPYPEDLCSLCGGNRGKDSMIGCKDKIHVCMECVGLLAEIKQEKESRKRDDAIQQLSHSLRANGSVTEEQLNRLYTDIAAGKIPGIRIE